MTTSRCATPTPLAALALTLLLSVNAAWAERLKLRIMGTTDLHMNVVNWDHYQDKATDEYGLAKTATLIRAARAENPNSLLLDNGDLLQGSPLGDYVAAVKPLAAGQVHPMYKVMNHLRYDAANIGNHEFNFGLPFLHQALATAALPYVNANVVLDGPEARHAYTPYVLLDRVFSTSSGAKVTLKVGVIGFVPPQIMQWDLRNLSGRMQARDIVETARRLVPEIKAQGAHVIVAVPHSGFEVGETIFMAENVVAHKAGTWAVVDSRAAIPAGTLNLRHVADLYIYPNTLMAVKLSGAQVREWLEMSAGAFHRIDPAGAREQQLIDPDFRSYNFDIVDGVSYRLDLTQPARYSRGGKVVDANARRVVGLSFEGKPIDDKAEFIVVTNNYRALGGGNFPALDGNHIVLRAPDENREALVMYLKAQGRVDPSADGNWRIQAVPGVKLLFTSGAGGIAHLGRYPHIKPVKEQGDGWALFELRP